MNNIDDLLKKLSYQVKFMGDAFCHGYSCGMTMINSHTLNRFSLVSEDAKESVYKTSEGIILKVRHIKEGDTLSVSTSIENGSKESVTLEMLASFALQDMIFDKVYRMQSFWSAEGKLRCETVNDLHLECSWAHNGTRSEKFGTVGSMPVRKYFPFLCVEDSDSGVFTGVQLYIPSSWQLEMFIRDKESYIIAGGIADRDFGQWTKVLAPGEVFETPKAVLAVGDSLLEVCDKLVKAQKPAISVQDQKMSVLFNEYCTTWGNPTFDNVKKIADKIEGKGIDFLVIDSGWYGDAENWWDMVGDWRINEKRFPGGMKPIADYIRSKGMIPGLWYEMESIASQSEQFKDLEHCVKKDGYPLTVNDRHFWDMESEFVTEYLDKMMIDNLKNSGFGYVKIDYNETMGMGVDGDESFGENLRKKLLASQKYFKRIAEKIPGIVIENCSSGGHRLEPSMMELVSEASFSDAHETKAMPLIAANLHRVIRPDQSQIWAVMRAKDDDNRINYSLCNTFLGRMCLSGDIYDLSDHQWSLIDDAISFYKEVSEIVRSGKTVEIKADTDGYNKPTGNQLVVRDYEDRRLIVFHRFENSVSFEEFAGAYAGNPSYKEIRKFGNAECDFSAMAIEYLTAI